MRLKLFLFLNSLFYHLLVVPTKTTKQNKIVRAKGYVAKTHEEAVAAQSILCREIHKKYGPYVFGPRELYPPHARVLLDTWPADKLAELAVAKLFDVLLSPANNPGHDLDTTGIKLNGECYGKIEVRSRSFLIQTQHYKNVKGTFNEYKRPTATLIKQEEMKRKKQHPADYYFACCWDCIDCKLVWFRIPAERALRNNALTISKGVGGGYGWADEYLWDGPC